MPQDNKSSMHDKPERRKLLIITNTLQSFGGGEKLILDIASKLKDNFEVTIANQIAKSDIQRVSKEEIQKLYDLKGVQIVDIPAAGLQRRAFGAEPYTMRVLGVRGMHTLRTLISKTDIIYYLGLNPVVLFQSLLYAKMHSKRFVLGIHNFAFSKLFESSENGFGSSHKGLFKNMLKMVTAFHVTNTRDLQLVKQHFPKADVMLVPNFITVPMGKVNGNKKEFVCLFVGRLETHQKGIDLFANVVEKTLKKNNKIIFQVAGSGGEGEKIVESLSQRFSKNVKWLGFVSKDKIDKVYANASVLVLTSRAEAFALVVIEGWTHGLPAISFDIPGPGDLIKKDFQGKLIKKYDTGAFSDAIIEYYGKWKSNQQFTKQKQKILKAVYDKYDIDIIMPELEKLLIGKD